MENFERREATTFLNQGQKIFGTLHLPITKGNDKFPAVLILHGFAGNRAGRFRIYVSLAEELAKKGIASLRIDFRGSGCSEGDFREMTIESEVSDALNSLEFLKNHPEIDINRLGLLGNSFGGAIAVLTAARNTNIKSLALLAAVFSSVQWKDKLEKLQARLGEKFSYDDLMNAFEGNIPGKNFIKSFFDLNVEPYLCQLEKIPLLIVHSQADERVLFSEAEKYLECRKSTPSRTEIYTLTKSGHDFSNFDERMNVAKKVSEWFAETL